MGESANPLTWNSSPLAPARGASTSSSPAHERDQQRPPSSPLGPYGAQRARPVTPGSFVSPRHSKEYPIPSTTADVLEARRQAFFARGGSAQHSQRQSFSPRANDGPSLQPGPSSASRRSAYKQPPSAARPSFGGAVAGSLTDDGDITASLYRQRFRERCQAVMARDRGRNKALAKARGRDVLAGDDDEDDQDVMRRLRSDDLSSSDMEDEAPGWQEDDEEVSAMMALSAQPAVSISPASPPDFFQHSSSDVSCLPNTVAYSTPRSTVVSESWVGWARMRWHGWKKNRAGMIR